VFSASMSCPHSYFNFFIDGHEPKAPTSLQPSMTFIVLSTPMLPSVNTASPCKETKRRFLIASTESRSRFLTDPASSISANP